MFAGWTATGSGRGVPTVPRFFTGPVSGSRVCLSGETASHIRVLRMRPGEELTLCDGQGTDYVCRLEALDGAGAQVEVLSSQPSAGEPAVDVTVYMAFAKADKLEHVIQKATELGAREIVAYPSARCVVRYDTAALKSKLPRWQKIAAAAAEQSGRGRIPTVRAASSWAVVLQEAAAADLPLIFYERERNNSLRSLVQVPWRSAAVLTGPEGGYTEAEIAAAVEAGLRSASLGARILRCETAPLAALTALLFAAGEM